METLQEKKEIESDRSPSAGPAASAATSSLIKQNFFRSPLPLTIIDHCTNYLAPLEAKNFFGSSRSLLSIGDTFFRRRTDYLSYENRKFTNVIQTVIIGINLYLKNDKKAEFTSAGSPMGEIPILKYNKGYQRASVFKELLVDESNQIEFKIFLVHMLVTEKNGKVLKNRVHHALIINFGKGIFRAIEEYVLQKYPLNEKQLQQLNNSILSEIHNKKHTAGYDSEMDEWWTISDLYHNILEKIAEKT